MIKQILGRLPRKQASKPENGRTNGESGGGGGGRGAVVLSNAVKTITRGMGSISLSTTSTTTTPNGSFNLSSYISEPLPPAFKDVPGSDRENLLIKKLRLCCVVFDFTDHSSNPREKEIKRQILAEAADYFGSGNCKFTEAVMEELVKMVSINLFRPLPSASLPSSLESLRVDKPESEEDEPLMDPAWPHLQIVYDLLLRFVASQDTDAKSAKKYIDHSFVLKLLDLFDSEDYREREYLKTILHRIYGKFMVHRPFIRKAINNIFYRFIFETERYNGVAELLEILNSIINGFALPLKEEHKLFLVRALIPLHKPKCMPLYHPQLSSCIVQFVEKDFKLADTIIRGLLKYWPVTNSQKEVLFIRELEEVLENTQEAEFQRCMVPLFRQIARCLNSSHFQVAECALGLWNNDHIIDLITQNRFAVLPLVFPALEKNMRAHWSQVVQSLTAHVRKILLEMDQDLFLECQRKYEEEETKAQGIQEKREVTWQRLEAVAASKAESEVVGGMSLYFRPLPFHMLCNIL